MTKNELLDAMINKKDVWVVCEQGRDGNLVAVQSKIEEVVNRTQYRLTGEIVCTMLIDFRPINGSIETTIYDGDIFKTLEEALEYIDK